MNRHRIPADWSDAFRGVEACVFVAARVEEEWDQIRAELDAAFSLASHAAREAMPMVYVVDHDDLLGRRGSGSAIVATALLSGARTAAIENAKASVPVNLLAVGDPVNPELVARWCRLLGRADSPTGELIRLGSSHTGKVVP